MNYEFIYEPYVVNSCTKIFLDVISKQVLKDWQNKMMEKLMTRLVKFSNDAQ